MPQDQVAGYNSLWVNFDPCDLINVSQEFLPLHIQQGKGNMIVECPVAGGFFKLSFKALKIMSSDSSHKTGSGL